MASIQAAQEVATITEQQEALNQLQNGTVATLTNNTLADMRAIKSHSWTGSFSTAIPTTITQHGGVVRIDHVKGNQQGSTAAVAYTVTSASFAPYAVLLAWDAPGNFNPTTSPNRVCAFIGTRAYIDGLTMNFVRQELSTAGSFVKMNDYTSKISVNASIFRNASTNMATLLTNFVLMP